MKNKADYLILFLYTGFVSIITGATGFLLTFQWYPMADMLRGFATSALVFALLLVLPGKAALVLICLLLIPYLVFAVTNVLHFVNFGSSITSFAVQSILETSVSESRELVAEYLTISNILIMLAVILLLAALFKKAVTACKRLPFSKVRVIAGLLIVAAMIPVIQRKDGKVLRFSVELTFIRSIANYQEEINHINNIRASRAGLSFDRLEFTDGAPDAERTYIFIVGEAGNRGHFGLYGYYRDTTPRLEAMRDKLYIFNDVISNAPYTVISLRNAFLFNDSCDSTSVDLLSARSLINLFNNAGFETYWLSNQTANADRLTGTSILAGDCTHRKFFNLADDESKTMLYDDVLLPALAEALENPARKKVIFLHTIGSHTSYKLRYPDEFDFFTNPDDVPVTPWREASIRRYVNEYDNSIRYVDYIVTEVIKMAEKLPGENFVLYFSDHGQEVYDVLPRRGQNSNTPSYPMYDIPFILWVSDGYKAANAALLDDIEAALDRPAGLINLPSTASELARLGHDAFEPEMSLINPAFKSIQRMVYAKGTLIPYDSLKKQPE